MGCSHPPSSLPSRLLFLPFYPSPFPFLSSLRLPPLPLSQILARYPDAPKLPTFLVAAVIGDFLGSVWLTPSEIIKQRMQVRDAWREGTRTDGREKHRGREIGMESGNAESCRK
eukprot:207154-Rhodomonas_salina.1